MECPRSRETCETRYYVAAGWDIYAARLTAAGPEFIDAGGGAVGLDGLVSANPGWAAEFVNANNIIVSADGNSLYIGAWRDPIHVISGIAGGTNHTGLTLQTLPVGWVDGPAIQLCLSNDGSRLYDSSGQVRSTSDLSLIGLVDVFQSQGGEDLEPGAELSDVAISPDGTYIYYAAFATVSGRETSRITHPGDQILIASGSTNWAVDLDNNSGNGLTGINLPDSPSGGGTYNNHTMKITPDGNRIYMAAGSSGVLAVDLVQGSDGIHSISPDRGGDGGEVTMTIQGRGFEAGSTVALVRSGQPDIVGTNTTLYGTTFMQTQFNTRSQPQGTYDVVLTRPGGQQWRMANAFVLETARESATVDFVGEAVLMYGGSARLHVVAQNTGNNDITDLVVTLQLTAGTPYLVSLPGTTPDKLPQVDTEYTIASADYPEYIWISRLAPQSSYSFWLDVTGPEGVLPINWDVQLEAAIGFLTSSEPAPAKSIRTYSPIGDTCTIGQAVINSLQRQMNARGVDTPPEFVSVVNQTVTDVVAEFGASKVTSLIARSLTTLTVMALIPEALPVVAVTFDTVSDMKSCYDFFNTFLSFFALFSWDPNDKITSSGIEGYILPSQRIHYVIRCENLAEATGPAHDVVITDDLDSDLDYSTLTIGDSSHPELLTTQFNPASGRLVFTFTAIDLPPNRTPPEGEAWVAYSILPLAGLPSGTEIRNHADIVFDINPPIVTPEIVHRIDYTAPVSSMTDLPATTNETAFTVQWSGSDDGVGVKDYTIYVSTNGGAYMPWMIGTNQTSATFTGAVDSTYYFYCITADQLGNTETTPTAPDTMTTIQLSAPPAPTGCGASAGGIGILAIMSFVGLLRASIKTSRDQPARRGG